jgi:hypothetical protein
MYKDKVDEKGLVVAALASVPGGDDQGKKERTIHPSVAANARSLEDKIAPGLWYMSDRRSDGDRHRDISQTEQKSLCGSFAAVARVQAGSPYFRRRRCKS